MRSREGKGHSQQDLTAGPASTADQSLAFGVVVIGQLFACADGPPRAYPDRAVDDLNVAVGTAGMIDEARVVAADARVDHGAIGQLEAPDAPASDVPPLALEALLVRDPLARVVDDARV